jgi:hypothetical protein
MSMGEMTNLQKINYPKTQLAEKPVHKMTKMLWWMFLAS